MKNRANCAGWGGTERLLVRCPGVICAYRATDGFKLGEIAAKGEGADGLAADDSASRVLLPGDPPTALPYPTTWTADTPGPPGKPSTKPAAKAIPAPTAKKPSPKPPATKKPAPATAKKSSK